MSTDRDLTATELDLTAAEWEKSPYSTSDGGECVEYSRSFAGSGMIPVRDSKRPDGPALVFSAHGWTGFTTAVKHGELSN